MEPNDLAKALHSGQSVFLTGGSGTGKTHLTKSALKHLATLGGRCVISCGTTGVSALHHVNGMTLHSAFKLPTNDLPATLSTWVVRTKTRMKHAEGVLAEIIRAPHVVVLIDEISMLSAFTFELLDVECRILRKTPAVPFGGITFLLVGDFTQLPPVYNSADKKQPSRAGLFVFESPCWQNLKLKTVVLTRNHRQVDPMFSAMIHQLKDGRPLTDVQRSLLLAKNTSQAPPNALCVMIRRDDVNMYNKNKLDALTSPVHEIPFPYAIYHGAKSKDLAYNLQKDVEQNLYLKYGEKVQTFKTGCKVMLITNVTSAGYVNGDRGVIVGWAKRNTSSITVFTGEMDESLECPVVLFERTSQRMTISYHSFERKLEYLDQPQYAKLECIPICLAEASTVHKLQGASIASPLHIVCDGMANMEAAFYVALSRATDFANVSFERFSHEGHLSKKALEFYHGTYLPPQINSRINELIQKVVQPSFEESTRQMLEDGIKHTSNKRKFIDEVARWLDENK